MIYHPGNVDRNTTVVDVETKEKFSHVTEIDTGTGMVTCVEQPLRVIGDELVRFTIKYRSIHAISGSHFDWPTLFLCFGREIGT